MFWTGVAQFGPPGTPRKSAFFQEKGQKRMKKWGEVTFMKEWMEALYVAVILALTDLRYLVSFPRYGRLKKKCWYKQICNGTYWLLLTGHFGPVFIRPSQWSITAVLCKLQMVYLRCEYYWKYFVTIIWSTFLEISLVCQSGERYNIMNNKLKAGYLRRGWHINGS